MSDSDRASHRGTNARKGYRPRKGKDQAEREELSLTRSLREGTASAPAAPGCQENRPAEAEATPEGEGSKPKRQSADRGQSRLGEPWRQTHGQGSTKERTKKPPKTHSLREVHPERGHKRLQGRKAEQPTEVPTPSRQKRG